MLTASDGGTARFCPTAVTETWCDPIGAPALPLVSSEKRPWSSVRPIEGDPPSLDTKTTSAPDSGLPRYMTVPPAFTSFGPPSPQPIVANAASNKKSLRVNSKIPHGAPFIAAAQELEHRVIDIL